MKSRDTLLNEEDVIRYFEKHQQKFDSEWLQSLQRKTQLKEAIETDIDPADFDRWQHLQDVMFGNSYEEFSLEAFKTINRTLWEEDIEILELWSYKDEN